MSLDTASMWEQYMWLFRLFIYLWWKHNVIHVPTDNEMYAFKSRLPITTDTHSTQNTVDAYWY